mgnify:CR=1 FL=1
MAASVITPEQMKGGSSDITKEPSLRYKLEQLFIQAFLLLSLVPDDNSQRYVEGLLLFSHC